MATKTDTKRNFSGGYGQESKSYRFTYSFAASGGDTADTFEMGETDGKFIVTKSLVHVTTACTSGGSAVVTIGTSGDPDAFMDATAGAVANLVDDDITADQAAGTNLVLASAETIELTIATADLTAGEISLYLEGYAAE